MTCSSRPGSSGRATAILAPLVACILCLTNAGGNRGTGNKGTAAEAEPIAVKSWKFDDLAVHVSSQDGRPSFEQGRKLYKKVRCSACHRMNGEGNEFGPDLVQLGGKWDAQKILKHVLEPSLEINKNFQSHVFELMDGRTIVGLITAAGPGFIKVIQDPLKSSQATRVRLDTIQDRRKSQTSLMPSGLINTLRRDEVLDLIAYVNSRGNDQHPMYRVDQNPR